MAILALLLTHWTVSVFFQSSFHHRYASHRMFTMSRITERVFFVLTWIAQGSSYLSPRAYAILHREHHAFSDTPKDPHSPVVYRNPITMMWNTAKTYTAHFEWTSNPEPRFLGNYPEWPTLDRIGSSWPSRIGFGVGYLLLYCWLATAWWQFLFLPIHFVMGPAQGAIVNWCGHRYGYRNFTTRDSSRNSLPFDFITMGELFQNNHHRASGRLNFAARRFEFDPTYAVLRVLAWMRIIHLAAPDEMQAAA